MSKEPANAANDYTANMEAFHRVEFFDGLAWVGFTRFDPTGKPEFDEDTQITFAEANAFCHQLKARYKGGLVKVRSYDRATGLSLNVTDRP